MSNGAGSRMAVSALLNSDNQSPTHANGHGHHQQPQSARLYPSAPFQPSYQSSYTQSSPSNAPFNLRPVTWPSPTTARVKEEDSPNRFPHDNVHGDSSPSSSTHTPSRAPLELLSDVASRESPAQHPNARSRDLPSIHHAYPDLAQVSDRASVRLAARGASARISYNEQEVDELQDDYEPVPTTSRTTKRRWDGDNADARPPPPKKRSPSSSIPSQDPMIVDPAAQPAAAAATGYQSPKSKTRAPPATSSRNARTAEVAKQNGTPKAKKPRKIRQTDDWKSNPKTPQVGYVFKKVFTADDGTSEELLGELQYSRCMSNRYKNDEFPRCLSCTRRWAGDTCRFQGIRLFYRNATGELKGIDFVTAPVSASQDMAYPQQWNTEFNSHHVRLVKEVAARGLLETLLEEEVHVRQEDIVRRQRETDCRATCDTCLTAVFAGSWICTNCGREACSACHDRVAEISTDSKEKKKTLDVSPFFLTCTKKQEHVISNFRAITRFSRTEIIDAIREMKLFLEPEDPLQKLPTPVDPSGSGAPVYSSLLPRCDIPSGRPLSEALLTVHSSAPAPTEEQFCSKLPEPADRGLAYRPVRILHHTELTDAAFAPLWETGTPFVVSGLGELNTIQWTPSFFIEKYGSDQCLVVECQNDSNRRLTVEEFFKQFGEYEGRDECLKLKDWPSSTDFKNAFPALYECFMKTVPMPNYSRRDGVLNISAHFPSNTIGPDLGPKMYNAFASNLEPGSKGSTRLHMDVADAVNIMQFCSLRPDGGEGGAVWDIFAAEDTPKIRSFLRSLGKKHQGAIDPIHSQTHYLDTKLMQQLFDTEGVTSYRIYQRPGQAVFIPAGCAHQVCNLADCIKVAVDFVSPQNILRCERLTREFREQNRGSLWKEDILQLKTMLWYAWLSCSRFDRQQVAAGQSQPARRLELPANVPMPAPGGQSEMAVIALVGPNGNGAGPSV